MASLCGLAKNSGEIPDVKRGIVVVSLMQQPCSIIDD
jgi:hypothetical protein